MSVNTNNVITAINGFITEFIRVSTTNVRN